MLHLTVNGQDRTVADDVDPATPLLWVLRDTLALEGTKYGCGGGYCGACTVQLDGVAVRSCQIPVQSVGAKSITTIEGLAGADGTLHPLQEAWIDYDVPQCGYCQAGQLMTAASLLKQYPAPTDAQIDQAMNGNFCRCGCYNRIKAAIHTAAGKAPTVEPALRSAMEGEPHVGG
ncbi:MAG TPA: (2Fe-2S)-binding protein [Acidobacteriaceae bacterium]|nr:(2Fe-2S)-binding protein [Acidobacteriaceae bacterium]HWA69667.1 (2Fe-2S)-binding protein [Rhizomicrobium sp.]